MLSLAERWHQQRAKPPVPVVDAMVRDKVSLCMAYEEGGHHSALT